MTKKLMLLALAAVSAVMFALPAVAAAGEPVMECGGVACGAFTSSGGAAELTASGEPNIACTANTGSGKYTTTTTGEINLKFTGCTTSFFGFPVSCKSSSPAAANSGEIITTTTVFHNTYLTDAKTTPGVLVTPGANEHFSTIVCSISTIIVKGNGILGHLESPSPACNAESKEWKLNFELDEKGTQKFKTVTATGTEYDLKSFTGETGTTAGEKATGTIKFGSSAKLTCV